MPHLVSTLIAFVLALGLLIVVHEFGHFYVARLCGVRVIRFSVGFGRSIWRKRLGRDRTELSIGLFPLGGYVKMLDEREMEVNPKEVHRAFNRQSVGKRSAIVVAGPAANFLLAIVIYWVSFMVGGQEFLPILGQPVSDSPAAIAGLLNGEQVKKIDGEAVASWDEFRWELLRKAVNQDSVELEVINEKEEIAFRHLEVVAVREKGWQGDGFERLGLKFFRPDLPPVVGDIAAGGAADRSGLKSGDEIRAIDGEPVTVFREVVLKVRESADRTLKFEILRAGEILELDIRPERIDEKGKEIGRIGMGAVEPAVPQRPLRAFVRYGILDAGVKAVRETWDKSVFSLVMMGKMLVGEVSWRTLSGPVTIADYAGQSARLGIDYYLKFVALVSISLGVLNLLPVPVLDGGHLMYHMLEIVLRRPLPERFMEISQGIGLSLLLGLMVFAFYNDIYRLLSG